VTQEKRFEGALGFLGNRLPDREGRVRDFFFNAAQLNPQMVFLLGGNGWKEQELSGSNIKVLGHVYTREHNAFNSSVKMVLNVNRQSMASYGYSPPTRIFEAAGAAACIITDAWQGIEKFLIPQKECLVAENGRDVAKYVKEMDFMDAKKIGLAAQEHIRDEHTYAHRAKIVDTQLHSI